MGTQYSYPLAGIEDLNMLTKIGLLMEIVQYKKTSADNILSIKNILEKTFKKLDGSLEPMNTLLAFYTPKNIQEESSPFNEEYQRAIQALEAFKTQLHENITIETLDEMGKNQIILRKGKVLLKAKDKEYKIFSYEINGIIVKFEQDETCKATTIDEAVAACHDPSAMENLFSIRSRKNYNIGETVLPFFTYTLRGWPTRANL